MTTPQDSPDTPRPHNTKPVDYDICIIGSGAGGAVSAKVLVEAGFNVVMLEKGYHRSDSAHNGGGVMDTTIDQIQRAEDELIHKSWRYYEQDVEDDPTYFSSPGYDNEKKSRIGATYDVVGGGTVLYAGAAWRFRRGDFKKKSLYGEVEGASVVDWPVDYSEMERSYTWVEKELNISGNPYEDPTDPGRSCLGSTLPPIAADAYSSHLLERGKRAGFQPFNMPISIHSGECRRLGMCSGYPCFWKAKQSVDTVILQKLKDQHGSFQLKTGYMAFRIEHNTRGACSGVLCKVLDTNQFEFISARIVIVAASAVQTARILLNSDSSLFPNGLGNINDMLGKNLMFHIYSKQLGVFREPFKFNLNKLVAFHDFYFPAQLGEQFINHCSIQSGSKWGPIKFARKARKPNWGKEFIGRVMDEYLRTGLLQAAVEDLPREENRVTLHEKLDMYGMPAPKVTHRYHEMDIQALQYGLSKCAVILQACGAEIKEYSSAHHDILGNYTFHLMGTCRMGTNENDSLINKYCRSHAVSNLYVVDGSVFPTSAAVNPTLTIQANAHRVANHIVEAAKRLELNKR